MTATNNRFEVECPKQITQNSQFLQFDGYGENQLAH
jgi:hypothetical protein